MVDIRAFHGVRFDAAKTGPLEAVLTPPYDVIDGEERERLAAMSPYNMSHLILPKADEKQSAYEKAATLVKQWMAEGVLCHDDEPYIYLLRQHFTGLDGVPLVRKAFFALMKLPESGEHYILGHERTFDKPVADRLALLQHVQANVEPIFVMYSDAEKRVTTQLFQSMDVVPPLLSARTSDQVKQELWRVPCPDYLKRHFQHQILYIADGHHRFKTACAWRDCCRERDEEQQALQAYDYVMAGFVSFEDPGLKIYAAHRVLPASCNVNVEHFMDTLQEYFVCTQVQHGAVETVLREKESQDACVFVLYTRKHGVWQLRLKEEKRKMLTGDNRSEAWQALDVAVLHRGILGQLLAVPDSMELMYEKDVSRAVALVEGGDAALAFLLRPTRSEQVRDCAEAFEPMPQKSTYFFPKLPSGTVMYSFS